MSFTVTKTSTRPSNSQASFKDSSGIDPDVTASIANIDHALRTNPAVQSRSVSMSPDGLTKTTTTVWDSQASYADFKANSSDLAKLASAASAYNKANGIVVATTTSGT
jgi:hypothetical protein